MDYLSKIEQVTNVIFMHEILDIYFFQRLIAVESFNFKHFSKTEL